MSTSLRVVVADDGDESGIKVLSIRRFVVVVVVFRRTRCVQFMFVVDIIKTTAFIQSEYKRKK